MELLNFIVFWKNPSFTQWRAITERVTGNTTNAAFVVLPALLVPTDFYKPIFVLHFVHFPRAKTNGFYEHSRGKIGHKLDWSGTVFVAKEKHWRARKIKEAIIINALNPTKTCGMGEF